MISRASAGRPPAQTELARDTSIRSINARSSRDHLRVVQIVLQPTARARQEAAPASWRQCALPIALTLRSLPPADDLPSVGEFWACTAARLEALTPSTDVTNYGGVQILGVMRLTSCTRVFELNTSQLWLNAKRCFIIVAS